MTEVIECILCKNCHSSMIRHQRNQAVWWVCSKYPCCPVTAFEYSGKPKFCHEPPNIKPPQEMPLYLDLSDCYVT
jgi:ssDNA-binding Zn-finger/Zn-ribbon topoisomerase 1